MSDETANDRKCCMVACLLPDSCAQRGYCRLDRANRRTEQRGLTVGIWPRQDKP